MQPAAVKTPPPHLAAIGSRDRGMALVGLVEEWQGTASCQVRGGEYLSQRDMKLDGTMMLCEDMLQRLEFSIALHRDDSAICLVRWQACLGRRL